MSCKHCCKCERHEKSDALTALFLAVFALLFFLGIVWHINGPKSNSFSGYSERHTERARDAQKREEWAQYWYTEFQLREPPRFSYETVNKMKARCAAEGYQFKRVDFEHKITRLPGAVCLAHAGLKQQAVVFLSDGGYRKTLQ